MMTQINPKPPSNPEANYRIVYLADTTNDCRFEVSPSLTYVQAVKSFTQQVENLKKYYPQSEIIQETNSRLEISNLEGDVVIVSLLSCKEEFKV
jgi:hypothetical protein